MAIRTRISASEITEKVSRLCMDANFNLNEDVLDALRDSYEAEVSSGCQGGICGVIRKR